MRRVGLIAALGALLGMLAGVLTASPALAGRGPKWEFLPAAPFTLDPSFCGFAVGVAFLTDKEYGKLLKTPDGSTIELVTGSLTSSFTNLTTGKSITENTSGPGTLTTFPDDSVTVAAKGRNPLFLAPADAARFGLPTVSVTAGAQTSSVAADGTLTSLSLNGHVAVDVCAALS